ncbi:MAG: serine hydrolase [Woeseiaceae bacterium]|nr:serine hydrolase [Woeseiaceae bacterium]
MTKSLRRLLSGTVVFLIASPLTFAQDFAWEYDDSLRLTEAIESGTYGAVSSLLIEHDGDVLYEHYFRGTDPDTTHNMRSAGKTVTGMLLGIAIDNGLIEDVDVRAASYFDELRPFEHNDERKEGITLHDLLTMSGPLECDDWNSFSRGNEERMYLVEDWSAFFLNLPIKNRPSWEIPDDDGGFDRLFTYCTAGVQLLGEIVERASDEPAEEFAARELFDPIGIREPKWNYASSGQAHLGGGLELTTRDWARLGVLYVNRGRFRYTQVVSEEWVAASLNDYVRIDDSTNYGYLWWRPRYQVGESTYTANMMSGSGGNKVYALPEFGVVVVITKNDFRDRNAHATAEQLFRDHVVARLEGE